jgi:hypothetical protein
MLMKKSREYLSQLASSSVLEVEPISFKPIGSLILFRVQSRTRPVDGLTQIAIGWIANQACTV